MRLYNSFTATSSCYCFLAVINVSMLKSRYAMTCGPLG